MFFSVLRIKHYVLLVFLGDFCYQLWCSPRTSLAQAAWYSHRPAVYPYATESSHTLLLSNTQPGIQGETGEPHVILRDASTHIVGQQWRSIKECQWCGTHMMTQHRGMPVIWHSQIPPCLQPCLLEPNETFQHHVGVVNQVNQSIMLVSSVTTVPSTNSFRAEP